MIDIEAIKARLMHRPVNDEPHYCPETRSYIYTPVVPASEDLAALIAEVERLREERRYLRELCQELGCHFEDE